MQARSKSWFFCISLIALLLLIASGNFALADVSNNWRHSQRARYGNQLRLLPSDYLSQMDGDSRWPLGHTIRVYVSPGRPSANTMISNCFAEWSRASGGRIKWAMVSNPRSADYLIRWTVNQVELSSGTEAGLTTTDTYYDSNGREIISRAHTRILTRYDGRPLSDDSIASTCLHEIGHGLGLEGHSNYVADIMYFAASPRQSDHLSERDVNTIARLYSY